MINRLKEKQDSDFRDFRFDLYGFRHEFDERVNKEAKILEIGFGNGYFLERLWNNGFRNLWGIDIIEKALRETQAKLSPEVKLINNDMHATNFYENTFDIVVACHVLEHSCCPKAVLREIYRIIKSEGLIFIEIPLEPNGISPNSAHFWAWEYSDELDKMLLEEGFSILKSQQGYEQIDGRSITEKQNHYYVICKVRK